MDKVSCWRTKVPGDSGNRTRALSVRVERSHHYTTAPPRMHVYINLMLQCDSCPYPTWYHRLKTVSIRHLWNRSHALNTNCCSYTKISLRLRNWHSWCKTYYSLVNTRCVQTIDVILQGSCITACMHGVSIGYLRASEYGCIDLNMLKRTLTHVFFINISPWNIDSDLLFILNHNDQIEY